MAEEQLRLADQMSATLEKIYKAAQKLNKQILSLKSNIKALEAPFSMHRVGQQLLEIERKAIRAAQAMGSLNKTTGMASSYTTVSTQNSVNKEAEKTSESLAKVTKSSDSLVNSFQRALNFTRDLFFLGNIISSIGRNIETQFIQPQSKYISNLTRVALTSDMRKTPVQMIDELYDTASRTRAPIDATAMLYNRIALSGVKASNERIRRFVESFNKVTAISGTTGQENRAVMLQLAQGMGSNRLGGDEFRSISEQAPLFKYMLAKGLGVNPGDLKQMGAKGLLTAEAIMSALEKTQDQIDKIFKDAPLTIDQSLTILQNHWQQAITKQFKGYIAIRDLIKDITLWMQSPKGKEIITNMIKGWNNFIFKMVQWTRWLAPKVLWLIQHLKWMGHLIWMIGLNIAGLKIGQFIDVAIKGIKSINSGLRGTLTLTKLFITKLGLMLQALYVGWRLGQAMNNFIKSQNEKEPFRINNSITKQVEIEWYKKHGKLYGEYLNLEEKQDLQKTIALAYKTQKDTVDKMNLQYQKEQQNNQTDYQTDYFAKELEKLQGMADSSKNNPTGGKIDEVGRVKDDISIDNDGIEMMKAIAERQWVMQNEVTVPQNVNISVSKEADVDEERLAEAITGGMRMAVASSMRGAYA